MIDIGPALAAFMAGHIGLFLALFARRVFRGVTGL